MQLSILQMTFGFLVSKMCSRGIKLNLYVYMHDIP